jgi:benzil reductase ((S)-benzoin forming)
MKNVLIITGGNKGLGSGIIKKYKKEGYEIFSISREKNESEFYKDIHQFQFDVSEIDKIESLIYSIISKINSDILERIVLINNAGTLGQISKIEDVSSNDIENTIKVNYTAPLAFISRFIRVTKEWKCAKKIINISSGAASSSVYGWSVYCSTKSAVDSLTKVIALEQNSSENSAHIISVYPGIIDTDMQSKIRNSNESDFIDVQKFIDYKNTNELMSKDYVGELVFKVDCDKSIDNGSVLNVKDFI